MGKRKRRSAPISEGWAKKQYKKMKRKAAKKPKNPILQEEWKHGNARTMMTKLGLAYDVNKMRGPKTKEVTVTKQDKLDRKSLFQKMTDAQDAKMPRVCRFSRPMIEFCEYMINKYGDDYNAMARDYQNYYQKTPRQIKKIIVQFTRDYHEVPGHTSKVNRVLKSKLEYETEKTIAIERLMKEREEKKETEEKSTPMET